MHDLATIIAINRQPTPPSMKDRFGCFTEQEQIILQRALLDFSMKQTSAYRTANDFTIRSLMAGGTLPLVYFGIETTNRLVDEISQTGSRPEAA
jgi:hypothetical protein